MAGIEECIILHTLLMSESLSRCGETAVVFKTYRMNKYDNMVDVLLYKQGLDIRQVQ